MSSIGKDITAILHSAHLKALGFQKSHFIFSRPHGSFTEYFGIEPAPGNLPGQPWTFHLNAGISYFDIPARKKCLIPGAHAAKRHVTVTTTLLHPDEKDRAKLAEEAARVAETIFTLSAQLQEHREILRHSYDRHLLRDGFPVGPDDPGE